MAKKTTNQTKKRKTTSVKSRRTSNKNSKGLLGNLLNFSNKKTKYIIAVVILAIVGVLILVRSKAETPLTYSPALENTQQLDPSGKTIPKTNYPIPNGSIFLATNGNDSNDGKSEGKPVKTISRALTILSGLGGGTLVVRGGEYRDGYIDPNTKQIKIFGKPLTIQAYPNESPWFTGADIIKDGWTKNGSIWTRDWNTPQFCRGKYNEAVGGVAPFSYQLKSDTECTWKDSASDPAYPVAADPQLAFSNGTQLSQKGSLAEVSPGSKTFYYDWNTKKIYISEDPTQNTIELATRQGFITLGGTNHYEVLGIGFRRYASAYSGNTDGSVVYVGLGSPLDNNGYIKVENSVFTQNAGATLSLSGPKNNSYIGRSVFAYNHGAGLTGNGFANDRSKYNAPSGLILDSNIFNANNQNNFDTKCSASCGVAAVKINHMAGFTAKNNIFENTVGDKNGHGFWCDMNCSDGVIVNNISRNNGGSGIFYEISNKGIIANNLVYDNSGAGIRVGSANVKIYNNTIVNKVGPVVEGVWIYDDNRTSPDKGETWPYINPRVDMGPNTNNIEFVNNLVVGQPKTSSSNGARLLNFSHSANAQIPPNTTADDYFTKLDSNIYYLNSKQNLYMWKTDDNIKSPEELRTKTGKQFEQSSVAIRGGDSPTIPFVDKAGGDFRLKPDSEAYTRLGQPIPEDVKIAIGLDKLSANPTVGILVSDDTTVTSPPITPEPPQPPTNQPPSVSLSGIKSSYTEPANIAMTISSSDPDGSVAKVEIYNGNTKLGEIPGTKNSFTWNNAPVGSHSITAKATDDKGDSTTSNAINTKVEAKPTTPPPPPPPTADTQPPSVPANLSRSLRADWGRGKYVMDLKWSPSIDNSGTVASYQITRNGAVLGTTANTSFTDSLSLKAGTLYTYTVTAKDPSNNTSSPASITAKARCFWFICTLE